MCLYAIVHMDLSKSSTGKYPRPLMRPGFQQEPDPHEKGA